MKLFRRLLFLATIGSLIWLFYFFLQTKTNNFSPISPSPTSTASFKFAVMADIHLDTENFEKALQKIRTRGVDFVIIAGDLTSLGKKEELLKMKKILDESGVKYYVIPGNHDLWVGDPKKANLFRQVFGPDFQSFKKDDLKFILVNNGSFLGINAILDENGQSQGVWLEKELAECLQIDCLVFMHIPLNHPRSLHIMGEDNSQVGREAKKWLKLMVEKRVKEVFAGHLHFTSSYELEGLRTTVVGAITGSRNPQSPKFLSVEQRGENLDKKEVFLSE